MAQHVSVEELSLVQPPVSSPRTTLFLHNTEQQLFFPVEQLFSYKVDSPDSTENVATVVREALQKLLEPYYFLAGRIRVNEEESRIEIDCNGAGVLFASATCSSTLSEAGDLRMLNLNARKFLAYPSETPSKISEVPLATVQVTRFKCGGFIFSLLATHAIFDGMAAYEFYDRLARVARGDLSPLSATVNPDRSAFRCRKPPQPTMDHPELLSMPDVPAKLMFDPAPYHPSPPLLSNFAFKLFPFTPGMLHNLKTRALADGTLARCSSFEALAAHLWQAKTKASYLSDADDTAMAKVAKLFVVVNIRDKVANLPEGFSGNGVVASPSCNAKINDVCSKPLSFCVGHVQAAIREATKEYLRSVIDWCEGKNGNLDVPGGFLITPWSKLPYCTVDFGWGAPEYVAPAVHNRKEYVVVLSNCKGDGGVDVAMGMDFDKMHKLEEFLRV